ncbi:hypothetical protein CTI12_AA545440 [Artemisia annua]|uniref:Uncharacterized protein n=1 Tax=Artemisia annua TaxID=35608 RepID=A0A2U1L055_ARTAN|nr:hypothetical protein CTI12_AA545440 [Artemisia annua]
MVKGNDNKGEKGKRPETQTQPKFYDAIDQSIHIIQSLGIIEYGKELGLEKREILDEVEIWVKKREDFVSDELKYIFEQPAQSEAKVNEYANYQMLSFAKDAKYKYNAELFEQDKMLVPSLQLNLLDDYHAFIASIKNMIRKERENKEE